MVEARSIRRDIPVELKTISNWAFAARVVIWVGILVAGGILAAGSAPLTIVLGIVILGVGFAHGVELCHQALHNTGFTHPRLNEIIGVVLGLPLLVSFYEYRISHLAHHKNVGTPEDTEYFDYGERHLTFRQLLSALSMRQHYLRFFRNLVFFLTGRSIPGFRERHQPALRVFYITVIGFVMLLGIIGVLTGAGWRLILTWIAALVFVAGPVHALIELPEHYKCNSLSKDILQNTRTIKSGYLMTWLTNSNNFHVEHHMYPTVPLQNARKVHDIIYPKHKHYNRGYREFYFSLFRDMRKGGKQE